MPYMIKKVKGGYKVVNMETGKEHSKKGIPKSRAEAQMRLLQGIEHGLIPRKK